MLTNKDLDKNQIKSDNDLTNSICQFFITDFINNFKSYTEYGNGSKKIFFSDIKYITCHDYFKNN